VPARPGFLSDVRTRIAGIFLVVCLAAAVLFLIGQHGDPRAFIFKGTIFDGVSGGSVGYDGQFSYAIASDFSGARQWMPQRAYRYQRILYPLLARLLSLGQTAWLPWAMVLLNVAALAASGWLLADLLVTRRANAWFSLVFLAFGGLFFVLFMDLNEPLAFFLVLLGLRFFDRGNLWWSGLAFSLGGLTKEVALIFAVAAAAYLLVDSRNWRGALKVLGVSLAVYGVWAVIVAAWLGDTIFQARMSRIEVIPFSGLRFVNDVPGLVIDLVWIAVPALAAGVMVGLDWWKSRKISLEMLLVLANVALIAFMPRFTWVDWIAALRLGIGLVIACLLYFALHHGRLSLLLSALWSSSIVLPIAFAVNLAAVR
jgi:hypothetical protein